MSNAALSVEHLSAFVGEKQILFDVSGVFPAKSVSVLMGPNGSGKSTLAHVIMGDPKYRIEQAPDQSPKSRLMLNGRNILELKTEEKAAKGLFLTFQAPVAIPGVSVRDLLRSSLRKKQGTAAASLRSLNRNIEDIARVLRIEPGLLDRSIHEEFSGGERKKIELLQAMMFKPKFAIFDEIDTGVDVDALKLIAEGMKLLVKQGTGIILITHNERILRYVDVDTVTVLINGRIAGSGKKALIAKINRDGYRSLMRT